MKPIKLLFFLLLFFFALLLFHNATRAQNCNCYSGWNYASAVTITSANVLPLSNYEVVDTINTLQLITAGKMKSDGGDIRFADSLCDQINYWVQSGINTANTIIWFKVRNIPANGTRSIYMYYGNPAAASLSNPKSVFKFYEGFDSTVIQQFTNAGCGSITGSISGGILNLSWFNAGIFHSDTVFSLNEVYTAEMYVTGATGYWAVLMWTKNDTLNRSYSILAHIPPTNIVFIGKSNMGVGYCQSQDMIGGWVLNTPVGLWSITWIATGNITASFPPYPIIMNSTDSQHVRNSDLRISIGGIFSGTGTMSVDWIRARKYAEFRPFAVLGTEITLPHAPSGLTTVLGAGGTTIVLNWIDSSNNEDRFVIQRSTNAGVNWIMRDSVNANVTTYTDSSFPGPGQYCYRVAAKNCRGSSNYTSMSCCIITSVTPRNTQVTDDYRLFQNYPNPFNPVTSIRFEVPQAIRVDISVYDALGRQVALLVNDFYDAGSYNLNWDASAYSSGIYFCRMEAGDFVKEIKMVILK